MNDKELENQLKQLNLTLTEIGKTFANLIAQQESLNHKISAFQFVATGKLLALEETVRILSGRN